jgi:hypothetical protein
LHPDLFDRAKAAANARANVGNRKPKPGGGGGAPIITTPANVSPSFNGNYQTGLAPPDTTGDIGNDRYIQGINNKYTIYNRSGTQLNTGSMTDLTSISSTPDSCGFFGGLPATISDPQIMWDAATQRFYYTAVWYDGFFLSCAGLAIGFSKTATPASSADFCKFILSTGAELPDYPKLGDSADFLLFGYNKFSAGASTYDGSEVLTMNKPPAGSTCPSPSVFSLNVFGTGSLATPVPAHLVDDSNGTGYVVANPDLTTTTGNAATTIGVFSVSTNGVDGSGHPNPSFTGPTTVTVNSYHLPSNAPQKGTTALIDTLDGRFEAAVAAIDPTAGRGIAIWTAHAVFGSSPGIGAEERWYEINPAGSLYQLGAATSSTLFIHNGSISPNRGGGSFGNSMAMSVSTSSSTAYPAIAAVWKNGANAQSALTTIVQATGPNVDFSCSPCRWGDYSGAAPDPLGNGKVWLANQYNLASSDSSGTDWRTRIFALTPA